MRIGVVGSREYPRDMAFDIFDVEITFGDVVFSGGAKGADAWIKEYCELHKFDKSLVFHELPPKILKPELLNKEGKPIRPLTDDDYFGRNLMIAFNSEKLVCLIPDRKYKSGTWNTLIAFVQQEKYDFIIYNEKGREWNYSILPRWVKKKLKKKTKHKKIDSFLDAKTAPKQYQSKYKRKR